MSQSEDSKTNLGKNFNNKKPRLEELATPRMRIDNSRRLNAYQVRPGALTYEITETVNKLAQPKQRNKSGNYQYSSSSFISLKPENLVKEHSTNERLSWKEKSEDEKPKVETYAKIAARRKSIYLKRLYDFPKPMKKSLESGFGSFNSENKYSQLMRNYHPGKKL